MKTWRKLTPEETIRIYCVPAAYANDSNNHFWGLSYHPQEFLEGDWPLVVLSSNDNDPTTITLQVHSLPMDVLHEPDFNNEWSNFNPLEESREGGQLILPLDQMKGLCDVLMRQQHPFMNAENSQTTQSTFRLLDDHEIENYRLHPEWFPDAQHFYYLQEIKPFAVNAGSVSVITVSSPSTLSGEMAFTIMTFDQDNLLDESFTPLLRSGPQLYLNQVGFLELIDILSQAVNRAS